MAASRILGPLLQRSVADYFDVSSQSVDIFSGELHLSAVALRPRVVARRLRVSGRAGRVVASWSWRRLLTEALQVEVNDLKIQLDIEDCSSASESSSGTASVTAPSERNYVERLKRKIMDQLELRITGAHIRLEGCQGNQLKATAGLIFDSFSIHPAVSEGGLRQRVEMTLSAYAYYADPEVQLADVPPEAFVVSNASPSCWATRISGRRFVDWKGLQLQLEGQHMQVQWRREQLRCCLQLAQQAKGERIKSDDFADAREEDEFLECEDVAVQSWSRWLRDKWRGPPNSELGEELPEGVSESDRAILLEDGAGNGLAGADAAREKLEVSLMLPKVTLLAMDSSLQFSAGFMLQLDIVELDDWNFHGELLEFGVLELSKSADQLSVVRFEGADVPATLTITRREAKGELKLCLDRLRLHLRPALQRGVAWLTTLRPQDVADVADPAVLWRMELEMLQLAVVVGGEPWHYGPVVLESTGIKGSWEEAVGTLQQVVTLKLDAKEDILQPTALTATCGASLPLKLRAEPRMECHCDVEDLVSMVRSAKCLINYFSAHLESTDVSGWRGALEFECPELELKVRDLEVGFQKEVRVTTLKASYDGFSELNSWSASCEHCDMQVQLLEGVASVEVSLLRASGQGGTRMDGSLQSLRCQDPSHEEPALSCDAASGSVELAEKCHVTLRCPKMEVNTTESFLLRCKIAVDYILDFLETLVFIEPVLLEERPFGFCAQDTKIVDSSEDAVRLGLRCGWRLCGLQPPAEALLLELQQRQVPLTLLLMPEEEVRVFHMTVDAISLRATQISLERGGLQAKIAEADLHFDPLLLDCQGTWAELLERLKANYTRKITQALPKLFCNVFLAGRNLRDAAFCSASSSLAMLRFGGVATGAVASSVAEGVAQAFKASVQKGQELRRGSDEEASDGYRFGDLTRGLLSLARERGQRVMGTYDDRGGGGTGSDVTAVAAGSVAGAASFAYESAVVSSTLGATIGGTMLAPLGPAGVGTGMAAGSTAARRVSERMGQATLALREVISNTVEEGKESRSDPSGAYRFGDFTRGVLRAGREQREASGTSGAPGGAASSGGEADGTAANTSYRPGDFTRGLWSKLRK